MSKAASATVASEVAALEAMDRPALTRRWRSVFGRAAPRHLSQSLMVKAIAHDLQIKAFGGLSARTRRFLKTSAKTAAAMPPARGTRLAREWNGTVHEVDVVDDGYLWRGRQYRSLSAIALAITGTKWSGPRFFGSRVD